jgi:hypothetical protein
MRSKIPPSKCIVGHPDFEDLAIVEDEILQALGGNARLGVAVGQILRECIDVVIDTPSTARCDYEELEKTEKTYLGTRVEIKLRSVLHFQRGRLDLVIAGNDVDIKFTIANNWMIPTEAVGDVCMLVAADEARAKCFLGLIRARKEYLNKPNKDHKCSISAKGFGHIKWLLLDKPYAPNFWRAVSRKRRMTIFSQTSGTARVAKLFELIQEKPIHRSVINDVARQKDYMKRARTAGGARDVLKPKGMVLLSGKYDSRKIARRGLPFCDQHSFISSKY